MTKQQIESWLAHGRGPYTSDQLNAAFKKLDFSKNWKMPIDTVVPAADAAILSYAVPWHCGGPAPDFSPTEDPDMVRMRHDGYHAYIGS